MKQVCFAVILMVLLLAGGCSGKNAVKLSPCSKYEDMEVNQLNEQQQETSQVENRNTWRRCLA